MEKLGEFIVAWGPSIVLATGVIWLIISIKVAPYYDEEHNHYYTKRDIHYDKEGNQVVTFMRGEETITFIHMHKKYLK